jgi:hypothetical protein
LTLSAPPLTRNAAAWCDLAVNLKTAKTLGLSIPESTQPEKRIPRMIGLPPKISGWAVIRLRMVSSNFIAPDRCIGVTFIACHPTVL